MKIEELKIHNIASIDDATINFSAAPLADSSVFLIAGDTGSGKSTILDCICVALYGNTPRYASCRMKGKQLDSDNSEISISEPRQLLRRNKGEGSVSLKFTGNDNIKYEARWSVRRSRNKPDGKLQAKQRALLLRDNETVIATKDSEIAERIEKAVGLDFDQFCRTCMLAQGEFDRFLNSNDDEKAAILEKIIGDRIYSQIGKRLYEVTAKKRNDYELLKKQCEGFEIPTDEELQQLDDDIAAAAKQASEETESIKLWEQRFSWLDGEEKLAEEKALHEKTHREAMQTADTPEFKDEVTLYKAYIDAEALRNLTAVLTDARKNLAQRSEEIAALKTSFISCLGHKSFLEAKIKEIDAEESKDFDAATLSAYYASLRDKVNSLLPELNFPTFSPNDDTYQCEYNYVAELDNLVDQINGLRYNEQVTEVANRLNVIQSFRQASTILDEARKKRKESKETLEETRMTVENLEKEVEKAKEVSSEADKALNKAQERYDEHCHTIDDWAKEMRRKLHPGQECPVCGHMIEDVLPSEEHFQKLMKPFEEDLKAAKNNQEKADKELATLSAGLSTESKLLTRLQKQYDADKSVDKAAGEVNNLLTRHSDILSPDIEVKVLDNTYNKLIDRQKEITAKVSAADDVRQLITDAKRNFKSRDSRHKTRNDERTRRNGTLSAITLSINSILESIPEWRPDDDAQIRETANEPDHTTLLKNVLTSRSMMKSLNDTIKETERRIAEEKGNHSDWNEDFIRSLVAMTPKDAERLNSHIDTVKESVTRSEQNLKNVAKRIADHKQSRPEMEEETTKELCEEERKLHAESLEKANRQHGALRERRKRYDEDIKRKKNVNDRKVKAGEEYDRWNSLCSELGSADGKLFRRIALSYVLENLVVSANEYMRRLFPRYSLSVQPGTYVLNVRDRYMDSSSRAVSGISGGETFIVSLALALALADIGGAMTVNILFIDEGFGSLSGEPLNNAIETLRQLSSRAGRRVGIISHVEELRDRIPVQIRVKASAGKSVSTISVHPDMSNS